MQKLELTWIGKGDEPAVEPRVVSRILRTFADGVPRRFQLTSATVST